MRKGSPLPLLMRKGSASLALLMRKESPPFADEERECPPLTLGEQLADLVGRAGHDGLGVPVVMLGVRDGLVHLPVGLGDQLHRPPFQRLPANQQ